MIKGVKRTNLTPDNILKLISPYDIFRRYYRGKIELNKQIFSPFRYEQHESFIVGSKYGDLHFVDFASGQRGGCFDFVMELFHVSLDEALRLVDRDFGLGLTSGTNTGEYKRIVKEYQQPEELGKRYSLIQVVTRKFTKEELDYQNSYYQDIEDLRANHIYSISKAYLNRKLLPIKDNEIRFGYLYESYWKLYFPFRDKKGKWISNVPLTMSYGLENLSKDHNSLVCKSLKDYSVCRKVYPYTCGIQNESLAALSDETVDYINKNSKEVFYGGDSDVPGKRASYEITRFFKWKHINPPDNLLPSTKDWADWGRLQGLNVIGDHFIQKGLFG